MASTLIIIYHKILPVFKAINPAMVDNHNVKNLISTTIITASDMSIFCKENNPIRLLSATPIPPGIKDNAPTINEPE